MATLGRRVVERTGTPRPSDRQKMEQIWIVAVFTEITVPLDFPQNLKDHHPGPPRQTLWLPAVLEACLSLLPTPLPHTASFCGPSPPPHPLWSEVTILFRLRHIRTNIIVFKVCPGLPSMVRWPACRFSRSKTRQSSPPNVGLVAASPLRGYLLSFRKHSLSHQQELFRQLFVDLTSGNCSNRRTSLLHFHPQLPGEDPS